MEQFGERLDLAARDLSAAGFNGLDYEFGGSACVSELFTEPLLGQAEGDAGGLDFI